MKEEEEKGDVEEKEEEVQSSDVSRVEEKKEENSAEKSPDVSDPNQKSCQDVSHSDPSLIKHSQITSCLLLCRHETRVCVTSLPEEIIFSGVQSE